MYVNFTAILQEKDIASYDYWYTGKSGSHEITYEISMKNFSADFRMIFMRATFPCVIPILRENY